MDLFHAENVGKAESNAARILGINTYDPKQRLRISFKGIDVEVANSINKALYDIKQKFPEMQIGFITPINIDKKTLLAMKSTADGPTLQININNFGRDAKRLKRILTNYGRSNWLVGKDVEALVYHEVGHGFCYEHIGNRLGRSAISSEMRRLDGIKFKAKGLSKYGARDGAEGLAEAFAKYMITGSLDGIELVSPGYGGNLAALKRIFKTYIGLEL